MSNAIMWEAAENSARRLVREYNAGDISITSAEYNLARAYVAMLQELLNLRGDKRGDGTEKQEVSTYKAYGTDQSKDARFRYKT